MESTLASSSPDIAISQAANALSIHPTPSGILECRHYHHTSLSPPPLQRCPLLYLPPLFTRVVHIPTFRSKFGEVVDESVDIFLNFFRHILTRVAKALYLFGDTGHSYTIQMEMVQNVEALDGV